MNFPDKLRSITSALRARKEVRQRLRGPANFYYAIADSITMLDAGAWQQVAASGGFFMSLPYLKMLENVLPSNLAPQYALIFSGEGDQRTPVAAVYMQIADISLAQTRPEKAAGTGKQDTPMDQFAERTRQRILTCGNLLTYGQHGIAFAPELDPALGWHGVAEVLYRVRQAEKLVAKTHFIMIKDLHAPHTEHAAHLKNLSYRYIETEPNMVLSLHPDWKSHDDYLASLASKYRTNIRNTVFKAMEQGGCTVEQLTDMGSVQEHIHRLYKSVQGNAGFRPFELLPNYFPALQEVSGERCRCSVVKRDGVVLGFLISLADGDTALAYHIGFDRTAAAELPIYLRLLHAGIADAIALGCKQISYGRTALEPKAALGAKPQPFGVLVRHRQPILNKMIKHLLLGIGHDEAPTRSPFKKGADQT